MIRIRVFADYCDFDSTLFEQVLGRKDDALSFVNDDTFTHVIIINQAMPPINIPKENVIGTSFEPLEFLNVRDEFIEYAKKHISRYFIGKIANLPPPFEEHYTYQFHSWFKTPFKKYEDKTKLMSLMLSAKAFMPGHRYRYLLASEIIKRNLPVDIRGNGCEILRQFYPNVSQIKGSFDSDSELLDYYKFTIAIENTVSNKYVSEKITSAFVYNTVPIYLGAKDIDEIFEGECCIKLKGEWQEDIKLIEDVCNHPEKYNRDMGKFRESLFYGKNTCIYECLKEIWCK
jgi:hypothetical protein